VILAVLARESRALRLSILVTLRAQATQTGTHTHMMTSIVPQSKLTGYPEFFSPLRGSLNLFL
jgi:hypothetical protein